MSIIEDIFKENRDRVFIIDSLSRETFTYREFRDLALALCRQLSDRGVEKNMRVAVCLPNCVEFAAVYFAALYSGFTVIPLNINFNLRELGFILKNCKAAAIIYSKTTESHIIGAPAGPGDLKKICLLTGFEKKRNIPAEDSLDMERFYKCGGPSLNIPTAGTGPENVFAVMYTSGTTHLPKGVAHSVERMIRNASVFIKESGVSPDDRFYNVLSMAYMAGFYNLTLLPFLAGASVVIGDVFNPQQALNFWQTPVKYKVNTLWLVPTILSMLLKLDRGQEGADYCRQFMHRVFVGTAPLPLKLREEFEERYRVRLLENYGLSETLFISAVTPRASHAREGVGKVLPVCSVSIVDPGGNESALNAEGEITVTTPSLMLGYLDEETGDLRSVDREKRFYTGDIGHLNSAGILFISGRKKDLIIKGGINISPQAIENVLMDHEAVEKAVIVGVPHIVYGEDVSAVVKLKEGRDFTKIKPLLVEHCRNNLSPVQQPSMFFEIEEFPLSSTGKIDKKKIRNMLSEKFKIPGFTA